MVTSPHGEALRFYRNTLPPINIVVIDDNSARCHRLVDHIQPRKDITVLDTCSSVSNTAFLALHDRPDVLLLPETHTRDHYSLLQHLRRNLPHMFIAAYCDSQRHAFTHEYLSHHPIDSFIDSHASAHTTAEALRITWHGHAVLATEPQCFDVYGPSSIRVISQREFDVLEQVCAGKDNADIARHLFIAQSTVKSHIASLKRKLGARNRTEIAVMAIAQKLVPLPSI